MLAGDGLPIGIVSNILNDSLFKIINDRTASMLVGRQLDRQEPVRAERPLRKRDSPGIWQISSKKFHGRTMKYRHDASAKLRFRIKRDLRTCRREKSGAGVRSRL
jgi:hypothetical protein